MERRPHDRPLHWTDGEPTTPPPPTLVDTLWTAVALGFALIFGGALLLGWPAQDIDPCGGIAAVPCDGVRPWTASNVGDSP